MNNNNNRATGQLRANNWFSGNCKKNEIQQLRYPWEVISKIGILGVIIFEANAELEPDHYKQQQPKMKSNESNINNKMSIRY